MRSAPLFTDKSVSHNTATHKTVYKDMVVGSTLLHSKNLLWSGSILVVYAYGISIHVLMESKITAHSNITVQAYKTRMFYELIYGKVLKLNGSRGRNKNKIKRWSIKLK